MLKVCNEVLSEKHKSVYVCEVETSLWNNEYSEKLEFVISPSQAILDNLEKVFVVLKYSEPEALKGVDAKLFRSLFLDKSRLAKWPCHEHAYFYCYDSHKYYWYNDNGRKYYAEYVKDGA